MDQNRIRCGALIKQISIEMKKRADGTLQASGLTFAQLQVLAALESRPDGEASLKELERHFRIAQSTAAGIAARLEKKGLIEPLADENDRRVKRVRITTRGRETVRAAGDDMDRNETELLSPLTDEERSALCAMLEKISRALYGEEGDPQCL